MAQRDFDHWWNTLSDSSYTERCCRKNQFRQRKSPIGNYQVDEDVWARYPSDGFMYIASVIAIDRSYRTCKVTFVDDSQIFTLPINHLRHVTLEGIQNDRYVDYGRSWMERTRSGTVITYDRYGEQQRIQYSIPSNNVFDDIATTEEYNIVDPGRSALVTPYNCATSHTDNTRTSANEPIWIRIPDPEEPTAMYSHCPIWNASSYAEVEKEAFKLCNQDNRYREAVQRAQRRLDTCIQFVSPSFEVPSNSTLYEHPIYLDVEAVESSTLCPESPVPIELSLPIMVEQQLTGGPE